MKKLATSLLNTSKIRSWELWQWSSLRSQKQQTNTIYDYTKDVKCVVKNKKWRTWAGLVHKLFCISWANYSSGAHTCFSFPFCLILYRLLESIMSFTRGSVEIVIWKKDFRFLFKLFFYFWVLCGPLCSTSFMITNGASASSCFSSMHMNAADSLISAPYCLGSIGCHPGTAFCSGSCIYSLHYRNWLQTDCW